MKRICVFAIELGLTLVQQGLVLVYGGGKAGLIGVLADIRRLMQSRWIFGQADLELSCKKPSLILQPGCRFERRPTGPSPSRHRRRQGPNAFGGASPDDSFPRHSIALPRRSDINCLVNRTRKPFERSQFHIQPDRRSTPHLGAADARPAHVCGRRVPSTGILGRPA